MRKSLIMGTKADVQKMKERLAAKQQTSEPVSTINSKGASTPVRRIITFNHGWMLDGLE